MADVLLDPYVAALDEFPLGGPPREQLRALVKWAVRAPSSHNSQPWVFRLAEDRLDLYADRSRGLPVVDPDDRELVISCGAALFHARIALRHFGTLESVEVLPDESDPDLLARLKLGGPGEASEEEHALFLAIPQRHTNRTPFAEREIPADLLAALEASAAQEGAWLQFLTAPETRAAVADLVAEGDRLQMADRHFRRELAGWLRSNWSRSGDGMPGFALGYGDVMAAAGPLVVRTFDLGRGQAAKSHDLAVGSPILAVLGTAADGVRHWLAAGQAVDRVLLRAAVHGIAASFLNQPIEVPGLREPLAAVAGHAGAPQLLLRLGYPRRAPIQGAPRRPVSDVIAE
jgi:nitroreductase